MPLGVYFIQSVYCRELLTLNLFKIFLIYLPLSLYPGQNTGTSDPCTGKKTGTRAPHPSLKTGTLAPHPGHSTGTLAPHPGHKTGTGCLASEWDWNSLFKQGQSVPVL